MVHRDEIAKPLAKNDEIVYPPGALDFAELRLRTSGRASCPGPPLRRPRRHACLQSVLDAVNYLLAWNGRRQALAAPLGFVPMGWKRRSLHATTALTR